VTEAPPTRPRRKFWPVALVIAVLLALTTWDVLHPSSPRTLRRAAFFGDDATVHRLVKAHPDWIDSKGSTNGGSTIASWLYDTASKALGWSRTNATELQFERLEAAGATPLWHAVVRTNTGAAAILLEAGADVRTALAGGTQLGFGSVLSGDTNLVLLVERYGVSWNAYERGSTRNPVINWLIFSPNYRNPKMVSFLISHDRAAHAVTNSYGNTPLHVAVNCHDLEMVQLLATNGANYSLANAGGETPLDRAQAKAASGTNANAVSVHAWLEGFVATNKPASKPVR
jgi:hypothetical protein